MWGDEHIIYISMAEKTKIFANKRKFNKTVLNAKIRVEKEKGQQSSSFACMTFQMHNHIVENVCLNELTVCVYTRSSTVVKVSPVHKEISESAGFANEKNK